LDDKGSSETEVGLVMILGQFDAGTVTCGNGLAFARRHLPKVFVPV
jgi:hypothetical protein